jgi:hypothetical protein
MLMTTLKVLMFKVRAACKRKEHVKCYLGDRFKMQDNIKFRYVLTMLLNHNSVRQVQQKPIVLQ